jgi:hypothetical protein
MSLESYCFDPVTNPKHKLNWVYSRRAFYNYKLAHGLAMQRMQRKWFA